MKKLILVAFVLLVGIGGAQVGYAQTDSIMENNAYTRAQIKKYPFNSYPPSKYLGMTLVKVDKVSGGYVGWYV
ncbi:hypothetical protein [Enterococcus sp.]|uniref:hypothetical protein n=1 Tax=Enterococcus sp. TaxID=35783 RepID=UPI002FC60C36